MDETSSDKPPLRCRIILFYSYLELSADIFQRDSKPLLFSPSKWELNEIVNILRSTKLDLTLYSKYILHKLSNKVLLCG